MDSRHLSTRGRAGSPRPKTQRERSNSLPINEVLGCSTPEAQLLIAEGQAARRSRRSRSQRKHSPQHESITTFNPLDYLSYLDRPSRVEQFQTQQMPRESRRSHIRIPSGATDDSTSTLILPQSCSDKSSQDPFSISLGDYSANLAQFIKAQLKSIPAYTSTEGLNIPLSPRSCPDLSFHARTPPDSPVPTFVSAAGKPREIEIPPLRPPMLSQFSAWSSADGDMNDTPLLPDLGPHTTNTSSVNSDAPDYHEISGDASDLFPSIPWDDSADPGTARATTFPIGSALLAFSPVGALPAHGDEICPSSILSHPLVISSAPSDVSSATTPSYFDCKRPLSISSEMKDRIIAAVTPPVAHSKTLFAMSPWEGSPSANIHNVVVESQQRVNIDGLAFDMQRDFAMPSTIGMSC